MKNIFRKAMTVLGSVALVGATVGFAAAAAYPTPFTSNTAIVTGTNAAPADMTAALSLKSDLAASAAGSGGVVTGTDGDVVSLDTGSTKIWLNTSLNTAKSTLTKTDLPVVLADHTFSGDVEAKLTSTIKMGPAATAGTENSGAVIFAKQPKSSNDPVVGISMGSAAANVLYNATVTMKATNFTDSSSEGESITLFGREFTVSTATDTSNLVLFSSAQETTLTVGGSSPNPSASLTVDGNVYDITLTNGDSTTAYLTVNGDSSSITEGTSKKIGGVDIAVKDVVAGSDSVGTTATILVGANKLTFTNGATVTQGSDDDPIDGTTAYITGGTTAATAITVSVLRPDSSNDVILPGTPFVDPVFGSFKVDFAGLNIPLDDSANRDVISVQNSGDKTVSLTMADSDGNEKTFDIAYNATYASAQANTPVYKPANWRLADDSNYSIFVHEGANVTEDDYLILGNEDYGHLLQVTQIYNNTGTDVTTDKVKLQDVISGESYDSTFTSEGSGTVSIDGKQYTVTFLGSGDTGYATIKYPTGDSSTANTFVMYPTIQTEGGNQVALYEPLNISLAAFNGTTTASTVLNFPDGDGYTSATFTYAGGDATYQNWSVTGAATSTISTGASGVTANYTTLTIGQLVYNVSGVSTSVNRTMIYLVDPETTSNLAEPSVVIFEGKDDQNAYHSVVVNLETASAGTSTDGVGVDDILFSHDGGYYHGSATLQSDSDVTQDLDWYGTLTTLDAGDSDQKTATISIPSNQVYAQIYVGEIGATIGGSDVGIMTVLDTDASGMSGKNLIVVGGSAINSIAAELLGGAYSEEDFTAATGVSAGQFLIQSFNRNGKTAVVVAGYNGADTEKGVNYLLNENPTTDVGTKYLGTSATEATVVTN